MKVYENLDEWRTALGTHVGYSEWRTITQDEVDKFAEATGDRQWIHVDPARAKNGPFGGTIAHGYLTLALAPQLLWQIFAVRGIEASLNYGPNKVRFPAPLPVGSRIRAGAELLSLEPSGPGMRETLRVTVEREGEEKPVCVAETVNILIPRAARPAES